MPWQQSCLGLSLPICEMEIVLQVDLSGQAGLMEISRAVPAFPHPFFSKLHLLFGMPQPCRSPWPCLCPRIPSNRPPCGWSPSLGLAQGDLWQKLQGDSRYLMTTSEGKKDPPSPGEIHPLLFCKDWETLFCKTHPSTLLQRSMGLSHKTGDPTRQVTVMGTRGRPNCQDTGHL